MNTQNTQNKQFEDMNLSEKVEFTRILSGLLCLPIIMLTRRFVGYRRLNQNHLLLLAGGTFTIGCLFPNAAPPHGLPMIVLAAIILFLGRWLRHCRWKELCKGKSWYTYSDGVSYLEYLPIPDLLRRHYRINRFLDPLIVFFLSTLAFHFSVSLGAWLAYSAVALFIHEDSVFQRTVNEDLDVHDGLIRAEAKAKVAEWYSTPHGNEPPPNMQMDVGLPVGLAPDLHMQVEFHKARCASPPQDGEEPAIAA